MKTALVVACLGLAGGLAAQTVTVTGTVSITWKDPAKTAKIDQSGVVVWLKPVAAESRMSAAELPAPRFEIRQIHKRFEPHVLAVPVGATIWFPNLDPFFHNVFSLYDGNRFDLGLYEAGVAHSARFDRPGVCFLFCNIHPEMSAVVVAVDGPYGMSTGDGRVSIPNVMPGRYLLYAWHERARPATGDVRPPEVTIRAENRTLPAIQLIDSGALIAPHKNKYGVDYTTPTPGIIYK